MCVCVCVCVCVCMWSQLCQTLCQAPVSMGFSRQEYWNGLPFPTPGDVSCIGRWILTEDFHSLKNKKQKTDLYVYLKGVLHTFSAHGINIKNLFYRIKELGKAMDLKVPVECTYLWNTSCPIKNCEISTQCCIFISYYENQKFVCSS